MRGGPGVAKPWETASELVEVTTPAAIRLRKRTFTASQTKMNRQQA